MSDQPLKWRIGRKADPPVEMEIWGFRIKVVTEINLPDLEKKQTLLYSFAKSLHTFLWMIYKELRQRILFKTGLTVITSKECKWIAAEIKYSLNRHISVTTIKRVFGFAKTKHHFSKYTLATLYDYANLVGPNRFLTKAPPSKDLPSSEVHGNVEIRSFITDDGSFLSELSNQPFLHPEQLIITAMKILTRDNHCYLPICENGKNIGIIYTSELKYFINCNDERDKLIFHKLNFDLRTAITVMRGNG